MGSPGEDLSDRGYLTDAFDVLDQLYEPLVRAQPDGSLTPGLATSWSVTDGGRTLTFRLREGVRFSDGTPFDAAAAAFNLNQWIGRKDYNFLGVSRYFAGMATPDPRTLVIKVNHSFYQALNEMSLARPMRFMSPSGFGQAGELVKPIGTGPYKVVSNTPSQTVLVRNDSYWGPRPSLSQLVFTVIPDSQARLNALQAGEVDVLGGKYLSPLAPEEATALAGNSDVRVISTPSTLNLLLTFNPATTGPLTDPSVRRAISLATDRDAISRSLFAGKAPPARAIVPPNLPFTASANTAALPFDPARARGMLQQAGYLGGPVRAKAGAALRLRLALDPTLIPQTKALAEAYKAELAEVGIEMDIVSLEHTAYGDTVARGDYDMRFYSTYGIPYDPAEVLSYGFTKAGGNIFAVSPELDRLITRTDPTELTPAQRQAAYDQVWSSLRDSQLVVPIVALPRVWAVRAGVHGFELGTSDYELPLTRVTVGG
jgi:nickel transport system substrate-binding protein